MLAGLLDTGLRDIDYLTETAVYEKEDLVESVKHPVVIRYLTAMYNRPQA